MELTFGQLLKCSRHIVLQIMGSTFNGHILVEKLAKLNSSQQSVESILLALSHWCIFHMNKAKQVVEIWERQFHCSPREQRLAFLYLANDILQNSRRKGAEFVGEFWRVLPDALHDVINNGDDFGRNATLRLINIWEDRKVFGSRGQILKEEFAGRHVDSSGRNRKFSGFKLRQPAGNMLEKLISGYEVVYGGQLDEDLTLSKCRNSISCVENVEKEIDGNFTSGQLSGSRVVEELQGQHAVLRDSVEQLTAIESSKANLVLLLREALQEQEFKLDQIRNQLKAAQSHSEQVSSICRQLMQADQSLKEIHISNTPPSFIAGDGEHSAPVMFTRQLPLPEKPDIEDEPRMSAASAVAAKLTSSTSSAQMLTYVLSSLASGGVIGNNVKEPSSDAHPEKRPKLGNDQSVYLPSQIAQPPISPFHHADSVLHNAPELSSSQQTMPPLPPSSPPPIPPLPPPVPPNPSVQFMQPAGQMPNVPFVYGNNPQQSPSFPVYQNVGAPVTGLAPFTAPNPYQGFQVPEGFYNQPPSLPRAPISRQ
ncbi:CID domain [Dillenia turbinata]|uniref:CID domain n=1 Tax=Dillenia turbinata TaxID=194707 RepID=A0AAN8UMS1_9MAGN